MKLYFNPASPYSRIVRACAVEVGVDEDIELVTVNPWENPPALQDLNPIGRIPVLVTDSDGIIRDSTTISEYLDQLGGGELFPPPGPERWQALVGRAIGYGLLESLVPIRLELLREEEHRSSFFTDRWHASAARALKALDDEAASAPARPTIGDISKGVALGYIDFRFTDWNWRDDYPALAAWFAPLSGRPSFTSTIPQ